MGLPQVITLGPSIGSASVNLFVVSATPVSGTPMTLTGTNPDVPRQVLLTYGSEGSARTFRVTGTNASGGLIRQTLAVPASTPGSVATTEAFATITEAMPLGGGWTAAVTLGTNGIVASPWKIVDAHQTPANFSFALVIAGTINATIQYTYDNPNSNANQIGGALGNYPVPPHAFALSALTAAATSIDGALNDPIYAWRLLLNSGGTGAGDTVTATMIQAGLPIR